MTPASTRTRDRWTEARTGPCPLCPRSGKRPPTIQGTCDDTASWSPRSPADGLQRAALREESDGTRSRGLIRPSRRSTAPAGLSAGAYAGHQEPTAVHTVPATRPREGTGRRLLHSPARVRSPVWRRSGPVASSER